MGTTASKDDFYPGDNQVDLIASQSNGILPESANSPKIIAIGDALLKRRRVTEGAESKKSKIAGEKTLFANQLGQASGSSLDPVVVDSTELNHPYVVAQWVLPHTPCIIRGIEADAQIRAIVYAGGQKKRAFFYSERRLVKVETSDKEANQVSVTYSFDPYSNCWNMIHDGLTARMQGEVRLTKEGLLQIEVDQSGTAREEHPDGTVQLVNNCFEAQKQRLVVPEMEFLNVISHDLRSPLMSIQGLMTLFSSGALGELSDKAKTRVAGVEVEVSRLIRLVNDLLEAGLINNRSSSLPFEKVPVQELFEATIFALDSLASQKNLNLTYTPSQTVVSVNVDSFIRVLVNLVANAVKYSPEGETISLEVTEEVDSVLISVKDYGKGISESNFERIFECFQRVDDEIEAGNGGIGLGLAICKSIVEAHKGAIGLESRPGEGSTFWVRIPN